MCVYIASPAIRAPPVWQASEGGRASPPPLSAVAAGRVGIQFLWVDQLLAFGGAEIFVGRSSRLRSSY
jgi:hypothetical protein